MHLLRLTFLSGSLCLLPRPSSFIARLSVFFFTRLWLPSSVVPLQLLGLSGFPPPFWLSPSTASQQLSSQNIVILLACHLSYSENEGLSRPWPQFLDSFPSQSLINVVGVVYVLGAAATSSVGDASGVGDAPDAPSFVASSWMLPSNESPNSGIYLMPVFLKWL